MTQALSILLLVALLVHLGAHLAIVVGLVQRREWSKAALALFVAPLAPWWAWLEGMKLQTYLWGGSLAAFALGVALS